MAEIIEFNPKLINYEYFSKGILDEVCKCDTDISDYKIQISTPNGDVYDVLAGYVSHEDRIIVLHVE